MMQSCGCKKRIVEPTKMNAVDEQVSDGCIRKNHTDDYSSLVGPIKPKITSKHILYILVMSAVIFKHRAHLTKEQ